MSSPSAQGKRTGNRVSVPLPSHSPIQSTPTKSRIAFRRYKPNKWGMRWNYAMGKRGVGVGWQGEEGIFCSASEFIFVLQ